MPSKGEPQRASRTSAPESPWRGRLAQPGWRLLPLRGFLGVTFCYAGLQKLANPGYLDPNDPASVTSQLSLLRHGTPIGPLLGLAAHVPAPAGLLIAAGELAVGVGTLLGLRARVAACGGALLALTFFLSVSWNTSPYYYGADIVFVFAWTALVAFGDGGVFSLDSWLRNRARRELRLPPEPATVAVAVPRLRALCARGGKCGLAADGACTRLAGCPVFPVEERLPEPVREDLRRRAVVLGGGATGIVAALALLGGGLTAWIGRAVGGTKRRAPAAGPASTAPTSAAPTSGAGATGSPTSAAAAPGGTVVAAAADIPVGQARQFTNPADGRPAWVVHPSGDTFVAFTAVCTHAGCPVQYEPGSVQFVCPCHRGTYDASTGQVVSGPPPAPLAAIQVQVVDGQIRAG